MDFLIDIESDTSDLLGVIAELKLRLGPGGLQDFLAFHVEPWLRMRTENRFAQEGDEVVGTWQPLERATEAIRASQGFPPAHPINHRTGRMEYFLVNTPGDVKATGLGAQVTYPRPGANGQMDKIATAQMGKGFPKTPPRPVLGVNENDATYITSNLVAWILGHL